MPEESEKLEARLQRGDISAVGEFVESNRPQLQGFIRSLSSERLLSVVEVDDLLQDIATSAIQGLATAPLSQYSVMQWFQQLARRRIVDSHRFHFDAQRRAADRQQSIHAAKSDGDAQGIEHWLVASLTSPSAAFSRDVRLNRVQQAIESLASEQREAVRMRFVEGLPTKEIAEKLGKTDVAIRVLLSRTMRQLEAELADVKPTR